jgi:uncharacterized protein
LCEIGEGRIANMDAAGIDVQVLSLTAPGVEQLDTVEAVAFARDTNDTLAEAVSRHPDRLAGFAALILTLDLELLPRPQVVAWFGPRAASPAWPR